MNTTTTAASLVIDASPEAVYDIISDYHVGHQAILPKPEFQEMLVERGGRGEGTVIRLKMKVFGRIYEYHQDVTEPEPGRMLVETDRNTGQESRFILEPLSDGQQVRVTIAATFPTRAGLMGRLEGWTRAQFARKLFTRELHQLAAYAQAQRNTQAA